MGGAAGTVAGADAAKADLVAGAATLTAMKPKITAKITALGFEVPVSTLAVQHEKDKLITVEALEKAVTACESAGQYARICLTEVSPHIQTAIGLIGTIVETIKTKQATSQTEACQAHQDGMDKAKKALTLYNAACALAQAHCGSSCDGLVKAVTEATAKYSDDPISGADFKIVAKDVTPQQILCQGYKLNMAAAGIGLMNMLAESGRMASCDTATTVVDCTKDPYNTQCAKTLDCSKTENFQQTQCICQRTPTASGCGGYAGTTNGMPSVSTPSSSGTSADTNAALPTGTTDSIPVQAGASGSGGGGAGSLGGAGGGGAGGLSGGGAAGKTGGADASKKEKTLNANILGGYDGGGGGGGSRSAASVGNSAYKDYLPGGAHDPNGAAVKVYGNGQVTSGGSKSIWEKVSERYWEAKPSLNP